MSTTTLTIIINPPPLPFYLSYVGMGPAAFAKNSTSLPSLPILLCFHLFLSLLSMYRSHVEKIAAILPFFPFNRFPAMQLKV